MRLRQVALVASDLDAVVGQLETRLGLSVAFRDPGIAEFGLRNAVLRVGDTFLEVVSPVEAGTTAGRYLERRGGDGGYMVLVQSDDLDADAARIASLGVRVAWSIDLDDIRGRHLHPSDTGGTLLSLDQPVPPQTWRWAGPWTSTPSPAGAELLAVELQADDPDRLAARWTAILARKATAMDGVATIALDRGTVRFVAATDGRGEGLAAVELAFGSGAGEVLEIGGVRIVLAPAAVDAAPRR